MPSFDVVSKIDMQEVDNAINSVLRELTNRYDFKGADFSVELNQKENKITIKAPDEYKLGQICDAIKSHGVKRGIDVKFFDFEEKQPAGGNSFTQNVKLKNGIDQEIAKKINKDIKNKKMKVQSSIRGEEIRVEGKKRNDLQEIIEFLKSQNYDSALQFINFRD